MVFGHGMVLPTPGSAYASGAGVGLRLVAGRHHDYHHDDPDCYHNHHQIISIIRCIIVIIITSHNVVGNTNMTFNHQYYIRNSFTVTIMATMIAIISPIMIFRMWTC